MGGKPSMCSSPCRQEIGPQDEPYCWCPKKEMMTSGPSGEGCAPPCHMKSDIMGGPDTCECPGSMEYFGGRRRRNGNGGQGVNILPFILLGGALILAWYLIKNKKSRR
jgi:hypothetical protein